MVTGLEFLRIACGPVQPRPYKFDPSGLVHQFPGCHNQQYMAKYASLAAVPLFVQASVKLHHPRPLRRFAHMEALARFEQVRA
ncbi:uncharacterized protein FOMMEDRAFT_16688 [Fomitiporia mediterranea MF3/22]|uniref:uncharacterized protein n=1 Tax=Fomitiporia mediterranea (strain MF3/22) TaxID=694068 RepID=UPI0004408951|nr:uncharacterized protein FOMMEDRAFT_16688 [Fomitiporia mediterranea MF3/22]EJD08242.1 hypothetical protein FOMMEDRAFT_16688 [Fomitiporia mediterranea MF3/22]